MQARGAVVRINLLPRLLLVPCVSYLLGARDYWESVAMGPSCDRGLLGVQQDVIKTWRVMMDALSKTTIRKSGRKGGALNMCASEKSWRRGMPIQTHGIFFYPVGLLEEMPTSHKQLTKSHPPWLVEPLRRKGGVLKCAHDFIMRRRQA